MKKFQIPEFYKSPIIRKVRQFQKELDPKRKDTKPTLLRLGSFEFIIPRHFGFCYGVENAVDIAFRAVDENKNKRIFLLSQMIHNPQVNDDLERYGVKFLQDTSGMPLFDIEQLTPGDIVIIPAFGAPVYTLEKLKKKGVDIQKYNTTCPFVERVWKKSEQIGKNNTTIILHGKYHHEETRSTFSRAITYAPAVVVVLNPAEAEKLEPYIMLQKTQDEFEHEFQGKFSEGFDIRKHFNKIGVVNQTTMLASETQLIADYLKNLMIKKYGIENIAEHFSDTRDTLCYATHENQEATLRLLETEADIAIVVGGYNSSNTSHLVELLETKFKTCFISQPEKIKSNLIEGFNIHSGQEEVMEVSWNRIRRVIITGGASCPDATLDRVINKICSLGGTIVTPEPILESL